MNATQTATDAFVGDWLGWRRQRDATLADPHGFLAVTSLHWLTGTPERFDDAPGEIVVELAGVRRRLLAFPGHRPGGLMVLFTDATSGVTTYAANRVLTLDPPAADGTVTVDFNRAANLPCAYTDLATCPLPPAQNRLDVPVEAGEKTPYERTRS